jgi:hypothetical protein
LNSHNGSAQDVGADRFTTYIPTFYFGKGLGDIPIWWIRPFAITGQVGFRKGQVFCSDAYLGLIGVIFDPSRFTNDN